MAKLNMQRSNIKMQGEASVFSTPSPSAPASKGAISQSALHQTQSNSSTASSVHKEINAALLVHALILRYFGDDKLML